MSRMPNKQPGRFADMLNEAIDRIAWYEGQSRQTVRETLGAAIGRASSTIGHYEKGLRSSHNCSGGCQPFRKAAILGGNDPCSFK